MCVCAGSKERFTSCSVVGLERFHVCTPLRRLYCTPVPHACYTALLRDAIIQVMAQLAEIGEEDVFEEVRRRPLLQPSCLPCHSAPQACCCWGTAAQCARTSVTLCWWHVRHCPRTCPCSRRIGARQCSPCFAPGVALVCPNR